MPTNEEKLNDTNEKILMKDHDILIGLYTNVNNLINQVHGLSGQLQTNQIDMFREFKQVAVIQTEQKGEIANVRTELATTKNDLNEAYKRMDKMDTRWKVGDVIIALGAIAGILIGLFKP